ncbi:hypothetical protein C2G38_2172020 [Gigaspora rosea]|uniref:Cytochrome P450 n=1 Tax=Gigaspora rosea TaxID=44941 RepID=A0A397VW13_9GLOM|nr:hypothetical protein C2G38_2172020 [Gigaspora rosea]
MFDRRYIILSRPEYIEKLFDRKLFFMKFPYSQGIDELGVHERGIAFNDNYESWKYNNKFFTYAFVAQKFMDYTVKSTNKLYVELSSYWQSLGNQNISNSNNDNWTWKQIFLPGFTDLQMILFQL